MKRNIREDFGHVFDIQVDESEDLYYGSFRLEDVFCLKYAARRRERNIRDGWLSKA